MSAYNAKLAAIHINHVAKSCLARVDPDSPNGVGLADIAAVSLKLYQAFATPPTTDASERMREAERGAVVGWLRHQSDLGANRGIEAGKGTTKRASYGGGSLALKRAADAIEAGEHRTNDNEGAG